MTNHVLTCEQSRQIDQYAVEHLGMNSLVLMENAGRGAADALQATGIAGRVVICCYKGNNGGDGFVLARHLLIRGFKVDVRLFCEPTSLQGDAATNFNILKKLGVPIQVIAGPPLAEALWQSELADAAWVVDALLGTGATGDPRSPLDETIRQMNAAPCRRMALDIPSGLSGDTGKPGDPTFTADLTCTFVAPKVGLLEDAAAPYVGDLTVVDIGIPPQLIGSIVEDS